MPRLRLFLYGTLQPGAGTRMGHWVRQRLVSGAKACAAGRIFAVRDAAGWFPALVPAASSACVRGTLCELELRAGELPLLDCYEGSEYRRVAARITTEDSIRVTAQLYAWRRPLPRGARPIGSGDFLGWLLENGLDAFSPRHHGTCLVHPGLPSWAPGTKGASFNRHGRVFPVGIRRAGLAI